jgi:hypothetical protein
MLVEVTFILGAAGEVGLEARCVICLTSFTYFSSCFLVRSKSCLYALKLSFLLLTAFYSARMAAINCAMKLHRWSIFCAYSVAYCAFTGPVTDLSTEDCFDIGLSGLTPGCLTSPLSVVAIRRPPFSLILCDY